MKYESLEPVDRDEALTMLRSGDRSQVSRGILRLALHDPDDQWVTEHALELLENPDKGLRGIAATALGHLARLHGRIDERVVPALKKLQEDPVTSGQASDALDDIGMFVARAKE